MRVQGPDGIERSEDQEKKINIDVASLFSGPLGKEVLAYMRSITLERVLGPQATNEELRNQEGMRLLYAIISQRIDLGHKEKANVTGKAKPQRKRVGSAFE